MNLQNKSSIDFNNVNFFNVGDSLYEQYESERLAALEASAARAEVALTVSMSAEENAASVSVEEKPSADDAKTLAQPTGKAPKKSKKDKPDSVSLRFANHILSQKNELWGGRVEEGGTLIHKWNGSHFSFVPAEDGMMMVNRWLSLHVPESATRRAEEHTWKFLESHLRWRAPIATPDPKNVIIPCRNSYIHLDDHGEITVRAPDPAFGLTHSLNITFGEPGQPYQHRPLPQNSKFKAFLDGAVTSSAMRDFIQEQCAMLLLPHNYQLAVWWWGEGGTGKSTLAELMCLYQSNPVRPILHNLDQRFGLEVILGASLLMTDEVSSGKWCEETWKKIVTQGAVSVERKGVSIIGAYKNRAKWLICSNDAPFVVDKSNGVWRRMSVVKWSNVVDDSKKKLDYHEELFREEGDAILSWILEGARRLIKRGRFLPEKEWPEEARAMKDEVKVVANNIKMWMQEEKVEKSEGFEDKAMIYQRYLNFCRLFQSEPLDTSIFWRNISSYIPGFEQKRVRMKVGGVSRPTYVANVKWCTKEDVEEVEFSSNDDDLNNVPF